MKRRTLSQQVRQFLVSGFKYLVGRKMETRKLETMALLLLTATLSACVAVESTSTRRGPRDENPSPPSSGRVDSYEAERLRRVMIPLLRAMDRPCRPEQVRVGIINQNEINAANAGNCEFYVTAGLLRRANDDQLRGIF